MQPFAPSISRWEMQQAGSYRLAEAGGPFWSKMKKMKKTKRAVMMKTVENKKEKFLKNKNKNKKKKTPLAQEKAGLYIPGDIVSEILLRLPARSLGKFRRVSKSWLSITSNTAFVRANAQRNRITRPSLIIEGMVLSEKLCLASAEAISESSIRLRDYPPLKGISEYSFAHASCDGLVCFYNKTHPYVINPLTGQSIALPRDGVELNCKLGFYFHRSTSKYRLIRFTETMHENEVLVVGESSWRRIPDSLPAFFHHPYPLDLNGNIYWLAQSRNENPCEVPPDTVVVFDEEEEVYSVISLPPFEMLNDLQGALMDFNGKLGLWVVGNDNTIGVWIMENVWIKRHSFNYAHIHECPSQFKPWWLVLVRGAVTIGDEELLIKHSKSLMDVDLHQHIHAYLAVMGLLPFLHSDTDFSSTLVWEFYNNLKDPARTYMDGAVEYVIDGFTVIVPTGGA